MKVNPHIANTSHLCQMSIPYKSSLDSHNKANEKFNNVLNLHSCLIYERKLYQGPYFITEFANVVQ